MNCIHNEPMKGNFNKSFFSLFHFGVVFLQSFYCSVISILGQVCQLVMPTLHFARYEIQTNEKWKKNSFRFFWGSGNLRLVNLSPPQIGGCNIDEKHSSWFLIVFFVLNVSTCFLLFFKKKIILSNVAELRCQFIAQCYSTLAHVQFDMK